jgi:hypothetical protein
MSIESVIHVEDMSDFYFGYHERVSEMERVDIEKSIEKFILIHFIRGDFSSDDTCKY